MPSVKVDEVSKDFGDYIEFHGETILDDVMYGSESLKHFRTIEKDAQAGISILLPNVRMGETWQNFQANVTEKGAIKVGAEYTVQRQHKVNVPIEPDTLVGEWTGMKKLNGKQLYDESKPRSQMALVEFGMQKVVESAANDRDEKVLITGKYKQHTEGVASPAQDSCDGLIEIMRKATITEIKYGERAGTGAAKLEPFAMGAIGTGVGDTYNYVDDFKDRIPEKYRQMPLKIFTSLTICQRYASDKKKMSSFDGQYTDGFHVDDTSMTLHYFPGLAGFDFMFAVHPDNLIRFIHKNDGAKGNLHLNASNPYKLLILADWHECYGISNFDYVWSNDRIPILP